MEHKTVFVKDCDGQIIRFAVLNSTERAVFVCSELAYEFIVRGEREPPVVGFPIEDVFLDERAVNPFHV
jgi:hypothetical protein